MLPCRPQSLTHGTALRIHVALPQYMWASLKIVDMEVISHFLFICIMMSILNILGNVSYSDI